jgi:branched-chain amino acid transport system substrate-binding protein
MDNTGTPASPGPMQRPITRRRLLQAAAAATLAAAAAACAPAATPSQPAAPAGQAPGAPTAAPATGAAKPTGGQIRIGAIYPLSGGLALLGEESWRGAELARISQNNTGGLLGREVVWMRADAPDANAAVSQANRLISSENAEILTGSYSSTLSQAASEVAERNKVIYWEQGGISDPIMERGFQYLFRTCAPASAFGRVAADFSKEIVAPKLGIAPEQLKVAIIHEDALYGQTVGTYEEQRSREIGLNVLGRDPYNSRATDLSTLVLKLKSMNPDVLMATSYIQDLLLFWKQARELNFAPKVVIGSGGGYSLADFANELGNDVNGILNVDFTQYDISENYARGLSDYIQLYRNTFNEAPRSGHSLANYVGTQFLFQTIEKAGSTAPDAIREAALTMDIPEGQTTNGWGLKFAGPGEKNAGQNIRALPVVMEWRDMKQLTIYPTEAAVAEVSLPWRPSWAS